MRNIASKSPNVIVIGDSTNTTLSAIRSFGMAGVNLTLILKCWNDRYFVSKSKFLKGQSIYIINGLEECIPILESLHFEDKPYLFCTFDEAAIFVDKNESFLSKLFITPCRGEHIGELFDKDKQCKLAAECGITVPKFINFSRGDDIDNLPIDYPILLKPNNSIHGAKSDIHVCHNKQELIDAIACDSYCEKFILQEFIYKEFELDCLGVRTDNQAIFYGAVRKIRQSPPVIGASAYGVFMPISYFDIDIKAIDLFLTKSGYHGPFSIEFLHSQGKNYFMEVNFRNDGLAYASTASGANLHMMYVIPDSPPAKVKPKYIMNFSRDIELVRSGHISFWSWFRDLCRTRCFIDFTHKDLRPVIYYYGLSVKTKLNLMLNKLLKSRH